MASTVATGSTASRVAIDQFFRALHRSYLDAEQAAREPIDRFVAIGDHVLHLRFAGPTLLEPLYPAFAHLACESNARPSLTVCLFESESTAIVPPTAPWTAADVREGGLVEAFSDERFTIVYQVAVGLLSALDRDRRLAVCWVRRAADLLMPERAAPLRRLLQAWTADQGLLLVHGGGVGLPDGGVLLAGEGGAGKSTSALACLQSSLGFAGDDYCLVHAGSAPHLYSLYCTGKTHASDLERLPYLEPMIGNRDRLATEKALYFLHPHAADRLITDFPLRAILAPRVGDDDETRLGPISRGRVLRALAPTTVLLSPQGAARTLPALAELVRRLPVYELRIGRDPSDVPQAIAGALTAAPAVDDATRGAR